MTIKITMQYATNEQLAHLFGTTVDRIEHGGYCGERCRTWNETYAFHLAAAHARGHYEWPVENVPIVAKRMAINRPSDLASKNIDGPAFKGAMKQLGIKRTRKALDAYLRGE